MNDRAPDVVHLSQSEEQRSSEILDEIRRVLAIEIEGLQHVLDGVDANFSKAVMAIRNCTGKVIVTGVGKSGIIASKIASTLSSTGTPAVFLHPAEALHGDVGLVQDGDIAIALGKSGESAELSSLLNVLRRMGVFLVALTGSKDSTLGQLSDIVVNVDVPHEACPLNLAPTASSTAALAVGDAIAIALMKLRDFSVDQFASRHPGGQLGRRLTLTVSEVMRSGKYNPTVSRDDSIRTMLIRITEGQAGAVSVVDDNGRLTGIITDFDIRRVLESEGNIFDLTVPDLMNPKPTSVSHVAKAAEALTVMSLHPGKRTAVLPVVDEDSRVVGMLHLADLVSAGV